MQLKKFNGLKVMVNKALELVLAIQAVYLKNHPEHKENLGFIETPPIQYLEELEKLINSVEHQYLDKAFIEFKDEATSVNIALGMNENYEFDLNRSNHEHIERYLGNINLKEFVENLKAFAQKIKWDDFFNNHKPLYNELYSTFCDFPENLNFTDIEQFYGKQSKSYTYIPSVLMNGGFGIGDKQDNLYYIKGIQWWKENNGFYYDKEYLLECMFHEFSHPLVNPLVGANLDLFTNIDAIYREAIEHNLPKVYSSHKYTVLYEYFVRANAYILVKKYYPEAIIEDWILENGFPYLNEIVDYTMQNMNKYNKYGDFFISELAFFVNDTLCKKSKTNRENI